MVVFSKERGSGAKHSTNHQWQNRRAIQKSLEEKEKEIRTLPVDQALSQRDKSDLETQLAEVESRLSNTSASYQAHITSLEQRIEELSALPGTIAQTLLDNAIEALKLGDTGKADAIFAEVEQSAQGPIEAAAEAAYQRAKIADEDINYRLALKHAQRAAVLMPDNGQYLNLAGYISKTLGEYDKAIAYYEQALKSDLATFGEDHPQVATYRNNLGGAWQAKGEYDKAIRYYEQAVNIALTTLGENHPTTQTIQQNL
ncbi:MAG: tetratricopeptide (TPR) repeat protein [Polaribacter sp.]